MAGFSAASVVDPLDWDFNPFVKAKGRITEPTDEMIARFLNGLKALTEEVKHKLPEGVDTSDPAEMVAAIDNLDADAVVEAHQKFAGLFAELCSGSPSRELLLQLPMRVRTVFYGWIQEQVMSPEVGPGAGNAPEKTLRSARAA